MSEDERLIADQLEGIPAPQDSTFLIGHEEEAARFASSYRSGRMHHAWLLSGPKGIGKATFAFHAARHILASPEPATAPENFQPEEWPEPLVRQVMQGGHPDLLHLTRPWDEKTKKFKSQLSVDEIRKTQAFYSMTAGAGGWRITIVDAADDMNASAANALLKILEEPPKRSVFFVITHAAGGLLPTIRSRCQMMGLSPVSEQQVVETITKLAPDLPKPMIEESAKLSSGSVRRGLKLAQSDVLDQFGLYSNTMASRAVGGAKDWEAAHKISDALSKKGSEEDYQLFLELVQGGIAKQVRSEAGQISNAALASWAEVWEKANQSIRMADTFNLDKKQVILTLFRLLFERNQTLPVA